MKQLLIIILIAFSFSANGQTAQDSVNRFIDSVSKKTSIAEFSEWLYSTIPAKEFNEKFSPLYNYFLQQKYQAYLKKRKP